MAAALPAVSTMPGLDSSAQGVLLGPGTNSISLYVCRRRAPPCGGHFPAAAALEGVCAFTRICVASFVAVRRTLNTQASKARTCASRAARVEAPVICAAFSMPLRC